MNQSPQPTLSKQTLAVIDPDGTRHVLGHLYKSQHPWLSAILNVPFGFMLDFNTSRHNKRMERLAARKRALS